MISSTVNAFIDFYLSNSVDRERSSRRDVHCILESSYLGPVRLTTMLAMNYHNYLRLGLRWPSLRSGRREAPGHECMVSCIVVLYLYCEVCYCDYSQAVAEH